MIIYCILPSLYQKSLVDVVLLSNPVNIRCDCGSEWLGMQHKFAKLL